MHNAMQSMQQHGKTFALAAKLLTPASRQDAAELYAFARFVDDTMDLNATNAAAKAQVGEIQQALQGNSTEFAAIQKMLHKHHIKPQVMQSFLHAQQHDEDGRSVGNQDALIDYAYGVAGSIGAMMRPILGAPESAEIYAVSLGIAMQLTNIARDVVEDAKRQRVYIPATFFVENLSPQALIKPTQKQVDAIFNAIQQLLGLAEQYYAFAQLGYAQIPLRNRLSIIAAAAMYRAIGVRILARGAAKYWQGRVSLGLWHKSAVGMLALVGSLFGLVLIKPANTEIVASVKRVLAT